MQWLFNDASILLHVNFTKTRNCIAMNAEMTNKIEIKERQLSLPRWKTVINFLRSLSHNTRTTTGEVLSNP